MIATQPDQVRASSPRSSRAWVWASVLTIVAATFHTGQSVLLFNGVPGDLGDSRLVNCILEHIYQWMCGYTTLFSPSQFYPVQNTLVYCDNHFGTALLYAAFRIAGASVETAFQGWFLVIIAANTGALLYLLRRLDIHPLIAAPLAFLGTSSSALVFKSGHPQTMPFFAFIIALSFLLDFRRKGDAKSLGWAILWFGYQHACYFYHGYFALLIFGAFFVVFLLLSVRQEWWTQVSASIRRNWAWLVTSILLTSGLLIVLYYPYMRFAADAGTRPMEELIVLAPNPGAWFSASRFSAWYSRQHFYKPNANTGENTFFAGWLIWFLLLIAVGFLFRRRRLAPEVRLAAELALATILLMAVITTWHGTESNLYLWFAEHFRQIRAFRAFGRIVYPLLAVEAVVAALLLNNLYREGSSRFLRGLAIAIAFAAAVETLSLGQLYYPKNVAQERASALIEMWKRAGFHDVLIFAPGYTNQPLPFIHMDCWYAALLLHKETVNGYSGNVPPQFAHFLGAPTGENAEALLTHYEIPSSQISVVTDWEPSLKASLGIKSFRLPHNVRPIAVAIRELTCAPSATVTLPVKLDYPGTESLPSDELGIFASYRMYNAAGEPVLSPAPLRTKVHTVKPGVSPRLEMRIAAPARAGRYRIDLSMVHEGVAWWADLGSRGSTLTLVVK